MPSRPFKRLDAKAKTSKRNLIRRRQPLGLHPTLLLGNPAADQEALGYAGRTTASRCLLTSDGGVLNLLHAMPCHVVEMDIKPVR